MVLVFLIINAVSIHRHRKAGLHSKPIPKYNIGLQSHQQQFQMQKPALQSSYQAVPQQGIPFNQQETAYNPQGMYNNVPLNNNSYQPPIETPHLQQQQGFQQQQPRQQPSFQQQPQQQQQQGFQQQQTPQQTPQSQNFAQPSQSRVQSPIQQQNTGDFYAQGLAMKDTYYRNLAASGQTHSTGDSHELPLQHPATTFELPIQQPATTFELQSGNQQAPPQYNQQSPGPQAPSPYQHQSYHQ